MTPHQPSLRPLLDSSRRVVAPGVLDAFTARIIESIGFPPSISAATPSVCISARRSARSSIGLNRGATMAFIAPLSRSGSVP